MLTNGLGNAPGDLEVAKVLRGGSLFLKDKNAGQVIKYSKHMQKGNREDVMSKGVLKWWESRQKCW